MPDLTAQVKSTLEAIRPLHDGPMLLAEVFPIMAGRVVMVTPKYDGIPSGIQRMRANEQWVWLRSMLIEAGFKAQATGKYSPHMLEVSL